MGPSLLFVMLVWAGASNGGAAVVQGFDSAAACQEAVPTVVGTYQSMIRPVEARCVALPKSLPVGAKP